MRLPEPPDDLPPWPARFYAALRERLADVAVEWAGAEDDGVTFGDAGVGIVLTHRDDADWVVSAQVSRVDAVVFVGPAAHHPDDPEAAARLLVDGLSGRVEVVLRYRGDALVEVRSRDARGTPLGRSRVGGPGAWARWRPETVVRRRPSFVAAPVSRGARDGLGEGGDPSPDGAA